MITPAAQQQSGHARCASRKLHETILFSAFVACSKTAIRKARPHRWGVLALGVLRTLNGD